MVYVAHGALRASEKGHMEGQPPGACLSAPEKAQYEDRV